MNSVKIGAQISIRPRGRDPGGQGTVTGLETKTFEDGTQTKVRVDIPNNPLQEKSRSRGKNFKGYWYPIELVE